MKWLVNFLPFKTCLKENGYERSFYLGNAPPKGQPSWSRHSPLHMIKNSPLLSWKTVSICSILSRARECPSASSRSCPLIHWEHQPRAFFSSDFISPIPQAYPHRSILQLCNHFNHVRHSPLNHFQFIYIALRNVCPQLNTRVRQKSPELRIGGERFPGSWLF